MNRDHTQLLTIAVLLVAVGIMAYDQGVAWIQGEKSRITPQHP